MWHQTAIPASPDLSSWIEHPDNRPTEAPSWKFMWSGMWQERSTELGRGNPPLLYQVVSKTCLCPRRRHKGDWLRTQTWEMAYRKSCQGLASKLKNLCILFFSKTSWRDVMEHLSSTFPNLDASSPIPAAFLSTKALTHPYIYLIYQVIRFFLVLRLKYLLHFALCTPLTWFWTLIMKRTINRLFAVDSKLASPASNFISLQTTFLTCRITHVTSPLNTLQYLSFLHKIQTPYHYLPTFLASSTTFPISFLADLL